ncbi:MAG: sigma-70 family RNA polymerase sigma factor [Planctomycetota bacterium]
MDAPTDERLLREFVAGKAGSFELLVRRHAQELHQFAMRFTGDSAAAEDVVQESFLQVYTSGDRFDPHRRFKPWLFTIAANKARDYLRKRNRRHEVGFDATLPDEEETGRRFVHLLSGESVAPDQELEADERRSIVRAVVEEMPDALREVLLLGYFHRFPYKVIGEILDIPLGTVKSRLHAAVVAFAERYREAVAAEMKNNE